MLGAGIYRFTAKVASFWNALRHKSEFIREAVLLYHITRKVGRLPHILHSAVCDIILAKDYLLGKSASHAALDFGYVFALGHNRLICGHNVAQCIASGDDRDAVKGLQPQKFAHYRVTDLVNSYRGAVAAVLFYAEFFLFEPLVYVAYTLFFDLFHDDHIENTQRRIADTVGVVVELYIYIIFADLDKGIVGKGVFADINVIAALFLFTEKIAKLMIGNKG